MTESPDLFYPVSKFNWWTIIRREKKKKKK